MSKNIVALAIPDRRQPAVSNSKKSSVSPIARTKQEEFAIKLREFARRIELGNVSYAAVMFSDATGETEEFILPYTGVKS